MFFRKKLFCSRRNNVCDVFGLERMVLMAEKAEVEGFIYASSVKING